MAHAWISLLFGLDGVMFKLIYLSTMQLRSAIPYVLFCCLGNKRGRMEWGVLILGLCEDTRLVVAVWCIIVCMVNVERSKVTLCPSLSPDIVNIINACLVKDLSTLKP
jgi:hypothetical protein